MLSVSVLAPIFLVEGGNRTLGIILAIIMGIAYIPALGFFVYELMKDRSTKDNENK